MPLAPELRRVYLFSAMNDEEIARIEKSTRVVNLDMGEDLFHYRDPCSHFYYLRGGCMKLYRLSPEGDEKVIDIVRPGQTFAEAVTFMEREEGYPVTATAVQKSEMLQFESRTFIEVLKQSSTSCFKLMAVMSQRLRSQVNEIDRLTLHSATFRLTSYLLEELQKSLATDYTIQLDAPKSVLASKLGIQPETFSRILNRLSGKGLIEVEGQSIRVSNIDGLKDQLLECP